jgi:cbb3-type cytochrome oxidase subunit 3
MLEEHHKTKMFSTLLAQINNRALTPAMQAKQVDGVSTISSLITLFVGIIFMVGTVAFMFMFLLGAVRWITSGGDKGQVESARSQVTQALAGIVVLFAVYAVARTIKTIFGIELINIDLAPLLQN